MTHDALADLLRDADAGAPPPPATERLAERVYRRARTRSRRRRVLAAVAVLVCSAALLWSLPKPTPSSAPTQEAVAIEPAEIFRLRADAAMHLKVADAVLSHTQRRARAAHLRDTPVTIESEREKAALAMLDHGDRLRRDLKQVDAALAAYRRTVELFPDTRWAAVARERIALLKPDAALPHRNVPSTEGLS
jgi:hypothetical protein